MKITKFLIFLSIFTMLIFISSCVKDEDFDLPNINIVDPNITPNMTFQNVVSKYEQAVAGGDVIGVFDETQDLYIEGYVISSDKAGNFFEELIIQNKVDGSSDANDPRLGFRIDINVRGLSDTYEVGRKVYVKLNGLAIGLSHGVFAIGKPSGSTIEQIQEYEYKDFVIRDPQVATLTPKVTTIGDLTEQDENTLIQFDDVQINRDELALTFAGEASDTFDGFRTLESCPSNSPTISLQTSTFADFKSLQVPQNRGSIKGILSRDFADNINVFVINSTADIQFNNAERCDPIELDCGLATSVGSGVLFSDDFETQSTNSLISGNGWTNYIEAGTEGWEAFSSTGSNASLGVSARIGSFRSGDTSSIGWLITPAINFDAQGGETLTFKTSNSFADGSELELLFSTDWDGTEANITSATWGVIPAAYIVQDSDLFSAWFDSGIVDLSCATGTMYIAFKYTGSGDSGFDGTYELDDININFAQ